MKRLARLVIHKARRARRRAKPKFAPRLVIFDFDGTIGDTFLAGYEILNLLADEFGFRKLEEKDLPRARNMRTVELLAFLGLPMRKLPKVARAGTELLAEKIPAIQPLPGMVELLVELRSRGFRLGIITSNSEKNVRAFLRCRNLEHFDFVRCSSKLFGKAREIRAARKACGLKKHHVLFVGDETRDIEACKKAGVRIAAVAWGYNSPASLQALRPDFFARVPGDILSALQVEVQAGK